LFGYDPVSHPKVFNHWREIFRGEKEIVQKALKVPLYSGTKLWYSGSGLFRLGLKRFSFSDCSTCLYPTNRQAWINDFLCPNKIWFWKDNECRKIPKSRLQEDKRINKLTQYAEIKEQNEKLKR